MASVAHLLPSLSSQNTGDLSPPLSLPDKNILTPTVFHNAWWLDAASDGQFDEVEVRSSGRVVGRLPYITTRKMGIFREMRMPQITHVLGPAIDAGQGHAPSQLLNHYRITEELLSKIDRSHSFYQRLHRETPETLAFDHAGYMTQVDFTYEILPRPIETLWANMRDKTRNVIRRASEKWTVTNLNDPYAFEAFYDANLKERGLVNLYSRVGKVCEAALERNQGRILAALDQNHKPVAAIFVPWDAQASYYLLSARSIYADNGVVSLLIWAAIRMVTEANLVFDFDGIGPAGNRLFYTGFGGTIKPRFAVYKHHVTYRAVEAISRSFQRS